MQHKLQTIALMTGMHARRLIHWLGSCIAHLHLLEESAGEGGGGVVKDSCFLEILLRKPPFVESAGRGRGRGGGGHRSQKLCSKGGRGDTGLILYGYPVEEVPPASREGGLRHLCEKLCSKGGRGDTGLLLYGYPVEEVPPLGRGGGVGGGGGGGVRHLCEKLCSRRRDCRAARLDAPGCTDSKRAAAGCRPACRACSDRRTRGLCPGYACLAL